MGAPLPVPVRVLKQHSDHLPGGKIFPVRGKELPFRAGKETQRVSPPLWNARTGPPQHERPAPGPPTAGALRPPGRALACGVPGPAGLQGTVPRGRGNAGRVSWSRPER